MTFWIIILLDIWRFTIDLVSSAFEQECSDGRVMAYLLSVCGTAVDPALEGFTDDGVERFLHAYIQHRVGYSKAYSFYQLLHWALVF